MKRKLITSVFILVLFLLCAGILSYSILLPRYIEKNVFPSLGDQFSTSFSGKVFSIGLNKASLGDITIGDNKNVAVSISSAHADYSVSSLLDKRIEQVRINGLTLHLEISEGRVIIPGLDLGKITGTKPKQEVSQASSAIDLPLQLDGFHISDGFLNLLYENQRILIPFDLQITRKAKKGNGSHDYYKLTFQIFPQGQKLIISGTLDLSENIGMIDISAESFDLKPFSYLLGELDEVLSFGQAAIKGNTTFNFVPFKLLQTEIACDLESIDFRTVPLNFGSFAENGEAVKPLHLKISGRERQWNISLQGSTIHPVIAAISLNSSYLPDADAAKGAGNLLVKIAATTISPGPGNQPVVIQDIPEFNGNFSFDIAPSGDWLAEIKTSGSEKTLGISSGQNRLSTRAPLFDIKAAGTTKNTQLQISLSVPEIHVSGPDQVKIDLPMAELKASLSQDKKPAEDKHISGEFTLALPGIKVKKDALRGGADVKISGKIEPQPFKDMKTLKVAGELIIDKAKAEDRESNININSIEGRIPWQISSAKYGKTGRIKISGIRWQNKNIGSFDSAVRLENMAYFLDGTFSHTLPGGLVTSMSGRGKITDLGLHAAIKVQMDSAPFDSLNLGQIDASLSNSYLNGELALDGDFTFNTSGFNGAMKLTVQHGRLEFPEKKYSIDNINLSVLLPELPGFRSAPAQKLLFDKASIGDLTFEQGKIIWQMESLDSIFIEESVVRWAGGRVFTNAVRISPDRKEFTVPILCDRLILSQILRQFGVSNAEGEGTVSGRLPLFVGKNTIGFEDGFLYSSPGQGGSIKVTAFDMLSAGIPKNTPQFAQVDFAAEALKNFQYNWVKLLLNSEGEDLIMQMQMDGKPLQSLPFSYNSQTGLFQRVKDNTQGINQPIRLDINFLLPLNRFLGYSGRIQDIIDKLK